MLLFPQLSPGETDTHSRRERERDEKKAKDKKHYISKNWIVECVLAV